ncbi:MAG: tyrosine-type recombinase/integrase, partial [Bryobacteraceae bacterium]
VDAGKDEKGKRKQIFKSGFAKKGDADRALRDVLNEKAAGDLVKPDPQSFAAFLDEWFAEYAARKCAPKTLERYKQLAEYIRPQLGAVAIQQLTALMLERVLNRLKDAGGYNPTTKKARPLSAKTVHHIAGVVNVAMRKAIKLKLLKANPMDGVELPPIEPREAHAIDADQVCWYLDAARGHGLYELLLFAAATGCRRGEALALSWPDVDLVNASARISRSLEQTQAGLRIKSTKTKRTRLIALSSSIVEPLKALRASQDENRRLFGADYRADLDLVFCDPKGDYLKPDSVTAKASLIARKAGLKNVSFHTLRHSHGSQLLSDGVPLPAVSKRLGHADVYTTAKVYAHALPKDDAAAADAWDARFQKAASAPSAAKIT